MKYINLDPKTMKNHGILVHLRHILINFLDFHLTICFWQYVLDPLPPRLLSKKHFFSIFWHGVTSPLLFGQCQQIYCFFLRLPLKKKKFNSRKLITIIDVDKQYICAFIHVFMYASFYSFMFAYIRRCMCKCVHVYMCVCMNL